MSVIPDIFGGKGQEDHGEAARIQCSVGSIAVGDMMKSTLGPFGMDKILQPIGGEGAHLRSTNITNDGATILNNVWLDNPAAKILVDVSKRQDSACGDGTTGVVIIASEFLRAAEKLFERKIHPQTAIEALRIATAAARRQLEAIAVKPKDDDEFRKYLTKIAITTLSSKFLVHEKEKFAEIAVNAVLRLKDPTMLNLIQIIKKRGGTVKDSTLEEGFVLEKRLGVGQPRVIENAKVLVANTPMDADKIKIYGAKVAAEDFDTVAEIEQAEKDKMKDKVNRILQHGCNVFINRQLIYNYPEQLFRNAGVATIEHADFDGVERLAAVLGAEIMSTFDYSAEQPSVLGECARVEEFLLGEDIAIRFSGCRRQEACTIILRGPSEHLLDEAERSLHDALAVVSQTCLEPRVVYGGGAAEMAMSAAMQKLAADGEDPVTKQKVEGKLSLCVEAFAESLKVIPTVLLDNGGFDSADAIAELKRLHSKKGQHHWGVDLLTGGVGDMRAAGVFESYRSKLSQLISAAEAAEQIMRVDAIIRCAPRRREGV